MPINLNLNWTVTPDTSEGDSQMSNLPPGVTEGHPHFYEQSEEWCEECGREHAETEPCEECHRVHSPHQACYQEE